MFAVVLTNLLPIGLLIAVGVVVRKIGLVNDQISGALSKILINVTLPATLIMGMQREFSAELMADGLLVFAIVLCKQLLFFGLGMALSRLFKIPKGRRGVFTAAIAFGNVTFLGIPVIMAIFGEYALFYLAMGQIAFHLTLYSLGVWYISKDGEYRSRIEGRMEEKQKKRRPFRINLAFGASLTGFVLFVLGIRITGPIAASLGHLGNMTTPLAMLVMGGLLTKGSPKDFLADKSLAFLALLKMILLPTLSFLVLRNFVQDSLILGVLVYFRAMPTGVLVAVAAEEFGADSAYAARIAFVTTLLSLVTLPLLSLLL